MHRNNLWVKHTSLQRKEIWVTESGSVFHNQEESHQPPTHLEWRQPKHINVRRLFYLLEHCTYTESYHSHHPLKTRAENIGWKEEWVRGMCQSNQLWEAQGQAWLWRHIHKICELRKRHLPIFGCFPCFEGFIQDALPLPMFWRFSHFLLFS